MGRDLTPNSRPKNCVGCTSTTPTGFGPLLTLLENIDATSSVKLDIEVNEFPKYNGDRDEHIYWMGQMDTWAEG